MRRRVAVVEQEDVVNASLTVRETLTFASLLRLPVRNSEERAAAANRVDELIGLLRLDQCADTRVGDATASETRGISGGERKRLCIAEQLLPRPALLFCDEPTSGLDASLALIVVRALAELAKTSGVTVVASIHQPSSQVFLTFDSLLLLDSGHSVYDGPTHEAATHFAALGQPCPDGWSHADWLLEVIVDRKVSTDELVAAHADAMAAVGEPGATPLRAVDPPASSSASSPGGGVEGSNTWWHEFGVLLRRSWRTLRPNLWSRETALMHACNGVITGTCWFRLGYTHEDLFPRISAIIIIYLFWTFFPLLSAPAIVDDGKVLAILRREYAAGAYRLSAWWWAVTTVPLAQELLWPAIHVPIFYFMANINDAPPVFLLACCLLVLNLLVFNSFGLLVAVLTPRFAMTTLLTVMTFFFTFTGLFVPLERTPFPWLRYANPCYYVDQIAIQLLIDDTHVYVHGGADLDVATAADGPGPLAGDADLDRADVLALYDVQTPVGHCLAFLVAFTLVCRGGALVLLRRKLRRLLLSLNADELPGTGRSASGASGGEPHGNGRAGARAGERTVSDTRVKVLSPPGFRMTRVGGLLADDSAAVSASLEVEAPNAGRGTRTSDHV